jgi:hypothetical protein
VCTFEPLWFQLLIFTHLHGLDILGSKDISVGVLFGDTSRSHTATTLTFPFRGLHETDLQITWYMYLHKKLCPLSGTL